MKWQVVLSFIFGMIVCSWISSWHTCISKYSLSQCVRYMQDYEQKDRYMSEMERLKERQEAMREAIAAVNRALIVDRKMSIDRSISEHFARALMELDMLQGMITVEMREQQKREGTK